MIYYLSFTIGGKKIAEQISEKVPGQVIFNRDVEGGIKSLMEDLMVKEKDEDKFLVFVSASGIAVRYISPYLRSKDLDPGVLLVDEGGNFVISLLSGHLGGANDLTKKIASEISAVPVITTASDVKGLKSIDIFARENDLIIEDLKSLAAVMGKILDGEDLYFYTNTSLTYPYENIKEYVEGRSPVLAITDEIKSFLKPSTILRPKSLVVGIGCKKNTSFVRLKNSLEKLFRREKLSLKSISHLASIDVKAKEEGILKLAEYLDVDFKTYNPRVLNNVIGDFKESDFVKEKVGVSSVSSRAAMVEGDELIVDKFVEDGITISIGRIRI